MLECFVVWSSKIILKVIVIKKKIFKYEYLLNKRVVYS